MYTTVIHETDFAIKPMNCPGGMLVYSSEPHSYRDLPLRVGELGPAAMRVSALSTACSGVRVLHPGRRPRVLSPPWEQMKDVIQETVRLFDEVYSVFGPAIPLSLQYHAPGSHRHRGGVEHNQDILKNATTDMGLCHQ